MNLGAQPFERAKASFTDGLAHLQAGRFEAAEAAFAASLGLLPGRLSTLVNLAAARLALGRDTAALEAADAALRVAPGDADGWLHRASALARLGRPDEALAAFDRLLEIDPAHAVAFSRRGQLLREAGRLGEAAQSFARALALGGDTELNGYYLAAVSGAAAPARPPGRYVQALFDAYAADFDRHLVGMLGYRGHEVLVQALKPLLRAPVASALDLGCGTGLCGPLVKPLVKPSAGRLVGVDVSAAMLARAEALRVYDALVCADLHTHLAATDERHDLVLAADVFIYVGALDDAFAGVQAAMRPGGVFGFSAEPADADEACVLRPSLRYAHGEAHLRSLAERHGFEVAGMQRQALRDDAGASQEALFVCLVRR